jgi:hypothetical protein
LRTSHFREALQKWIREPGVEAMPGVLALRRLRREDLEFKASLAYIMSLRPAWAT